MITNHQDKISFKMGFINSLLTSVTKITKKKLWAYVINKEQKFVKPLKKHQAEVYDILGMKIIKFTKNQDSKKYIVFFHGGGFVMSGNRRHHNFIINLYKKTGFTCYYIDYPLAPLYKAVDVINKVEAVVKEIQKQELNKEMILLGDSAGGNLALVFSKLFPEVKDIILLSPWLDLTMTNPDILTMERKEIMFSKDDLLKAAKDYKGDLELDNPLISPIYDNFSDKKIKILAGTDDFLYPDVLKFVKTYNNIDLHEYSKLKHDFMFLTGGKEQNQVIDEMAKYLI